MDSKSFSFSVALKITWHCFYFNKDQQPSQRMYNFLLNKVFFWNCSKFPYSVVIFFVIIRIYNNWNLSNLEFRRFYFCDLLLNATKKQIEAATIVFLWALHSLRSHFESHWTNIWALVFKTFIKNVFLIKKLLKTTYFSNILMIYVEGHNFYFDRQNKR